MGVDSERGTGWAGPGDRRSEMTRAEFDGLPAQPTYPVGAHVRVWQGECRPVLSGVIESEENGVYAIICVSRGFAIGTHKTVRCIRTEEE
jgi:hypothetical protein